MKIYKISWIMIILFTACSTPKRPHNSEVTLIGEGSSMALPLSDKFFKEVKKTLPFSVEYKSSDSFSGIASLTNNQVDFALSSVPMTDEMMQKNPEILHIPIAAAGINFAYNLPGEEFSLYTDPVYFTPEILAKILNKKITKWNDPEIVKLNQLVAENKTRKFPDLPITWIQRSFDSGDTFLVTTFLNKATSEWKKGLYTKFSTNNSTVSGDTSLELILNLMKIPGALTYVPMIYGVQNNIALIRIKNFLGTYGRGCNFRTLEAMKVVKPTKDNRVDLTYPHQGLEAGVATSMIYMLIKKEQNYNNKTKEQAQELVNLIDWMLSPVAQRQLEPLFFAGLTPSFRKSARTMLSNITYNGAVLLPTSKNKNNKS